MNVEIIRRIKFPKWWKGVRTNHVGCQKRIYLHAFDTETFRGRVFHTGFYDRRGFVYCYGLNQDHFGWLIEQLYDLCQSKRKNYCHIVGAHNLKFDLGVLLWKILNPLERPLPGPKSLRFSYIPFKAEIFISFRKPCFMRVRFRGNEKKHSNVVTLVDTFAFFPSSLRTILKAIGGGDQKLETPEKIGERVIPKKEILPYNKADCIGVYRILEFLEHKHRNFDVRFSVSLPQMSARIFRHAFLKKDFVKPPSEALFAGLCSYHGGKNTWTGKQGWYQAWDLDIRSAFPEAMLKMPNFSKGKWSRSIIPSKNAGFFLVQGKMATCRWGSLFSHGFKKISGVFSRTWVTSYELAEALRSKELLDFKILEGWVFEEHPTPDPDASPFKPFVEHFYHAKESAPTEIDRAFNKLILNSLYGKFIQKTEDELTGNFSVGGLFDPCVASLITGFVRAKIHRFEHQYKALHTATDGIITTKRPRNEDCGEGIGQLKKENFGPCLILRNKLYLHYDENGTLKKRGLHGFQGKAEDLLKMWSEKKKYYRINRLVSWAEGWRLGLPPGGLLERDMVLNCIGEEK